MPRGGQKRGIGELAPARGRSSDGNAGALIGSDQSAGWSWGYLPKNQPMSMSTMITTMTVPSSPYAGLLFHIFIDML
jgi:hypothetical protein